METEKTLHLTRGYRIVRVTHRNVPRDLQFVRNAPSHAPSQTHKELSWIEPLQALETAEVLWQDEILNTLTKSLPRKRARAIP